MSVVVENETETEPKVKRARVSGDSVSERKGNEVDRLSDLPDCLLIHLMTFIRAKYAVRTCVLSKRWKGLWKRVPNLVLHYLDDRFPRLSEFDRFASRFLSCRDGSVPLHCLEFDRRGYTAPQLLKRIVTYAVSHSIERLRIHVRCNMDLPPSIFSCQSLTSLDLSGYTAFKTGPVLFPKSLNLTALTSLRIDNFVFSGDGNELVEPFSSCMKLKTLVVDRCVLRNPQVLCISNATLVNLTIAVFKPEVYRVVLSTPNLCSFTFSGAIALQLTASNLSFLKEVSIDVNEWKASVHSAFILISWLQVLANVRSLTVSSSTLKVLSLIPDLLNTESPCLDNLKSLIVKVKIPRYMSQRAAKSKKAQLKPPSVVSDGAVDYLIRNSPFAKGGVGVESRVASILHSSVKSVVIPAGRVDLREPSDDKVHGGEITGVQDAGDLDDVVKDVINDACVSNEAVGVENEAPKDGVDGDMPVGDSVGISGDGIAAGADVILVNEQGVVVSGVSVLDLGPSSMHVDALMGEDASCSGQQGEGRVPSDAGDKDDSVQGTVEKESATVEVVVIDKIGVGDAGIAAAGVSKAVAGIPTVESPNVAGAPVVDIGVAAKATAVEEPNATISTDPAPFAGPSAADRLAIISQEFATFSPADASQLSEIAAATPGFCLSSDMPAFHKQIAYQTFLCTYRFLSSCTLQEVLDLHRASLKALVGSLRLYGFSGEWMEKLLLFCEWSASQANQTRMSELTMQHDGNHSRLVEIDCELHTLAERVCTLNVERSQVLSSIAAVAAERDALLGIQQMLASPFSLASVASLF